MIGQSAMEVGLAIYTYMDVGTTSIDHPPGLPSPFSNFFFLRNL